MRIEFESESGAHISVTWDGLKEGDNPIETYISQNLNHVCPLRLTVNDARRLALALETVAIEKEGLKQLAITYRCKTCKDRGWTAVTDTGEICWDVCASCNGTSQRLL